MSLMFVFLLIFILYKIKINFKEGFEDYSGKEQSACIKGIFIFIVFLSHLRQYATFNGLILDKLGVYILSFLGQLMVAMFLFYSGFGIYQSIKRNGFNYIKNMPKNRILKTFFELGIALITYIICNYFLGIKHNLKTTLFAFTGWTTIGNSNWYMFTIFFLYTITFVIFRIFKNKKYLPVILTTLATVVYVIFLGKIKETYWVNTALCYIAGMWYSLYIDKINKFLKEHKAMYYVLLATFCITFVGLRFLTKINYTNIIYNIYSIVFCLIIILFTMKIRINNKILLWFGNNLFWIYILQRLPMRVLVRYDMNKYIFMLLCFVITLILTMIYSKFVPIIENKIFNKNHIRNEAK